jgi:RHS repeat-associated protein
VLTSTIPLTLTGRLPGGGEVDAAAGLMYVGDGRYYDAALGVFLQPDPFGGAPEAPASLNRYAALGVSTLPTLGSVPGGTPNFRPFFDSLRVNYAQAVTGAQLGRFISDLLSPHAMRTTWREVLEDYVEALPKNKLLDTALGLGYLTQKALKPRLTGSRIGNAFLNAHRRLLDWVFFKNTEFVWRQRWNQYSVVVNNTRLGRTVTSLLSESGEAFLDLSIGVAFDVGLQAVNDWGMWRRGELTGWQFGERVFWAGVGGGLGFGVGFLIGGPIGAAAGILIEVVYELGIQPLIYRWRDLNPRSK